MGGYGSGWQGATKATVEGSLVLTAASLVRKRALVAGAWTSGSWGWISDGEDKPHATIGYEADLSDQDNAWLRLHYRRNGRAGGLHGPARDLDAALWRAPVVVYLPARSE